jgi:hypothetical protein
MFKLQHAAWLPLVTPFVPAFESAFESAWSWAGTLFGKICHWHAAKRLYCCNE